MNLHSLKPQLHLAAAIALVSSVIPSAPSQGGPISITWQGEAATIGGSGSNLRPPEPGSLLFLRTASIVVQFDPPESDDIDNLINFDPAAPPLATWIVHEPDAAGFGFDWTAFQNDLNGFNREVVFTFGTGPPFNNVGRGTIARASTFDAIRDSGASGDRIINFDMEEIRVAVDYYFYHPLIPTLRAAKVSFEIEGTGEVVPEASTVALLSLAVLFGGSAIKLRARTDAPTVQCARDIGVTPRPGRTLELSRER